MRVDLLDFTLEEVDALELSTGRSFLDLWGSGRATDARTLLLTFFSRDHSAEEAEAIVQNMTVSEATRAIAAEESLPESYVDGLPKDGGRMVDRYVVAFAKRFSWPPSVTRQQTLRDLHLISESSIGDQP